MTHQDNTDKTKACGTSWWSSLTCRGGAMGLPMLVLFGYLLFAGSSAGTAGSSVAECVKGADTGGGNGFACLGHVTESCLTSEKGQTDDLIHECYQKEYVLWDGMRRHSAKALKASLTGNALETFKAAEKAWGTYRTKACRLPYQVAAGRAALVAGLSCNRDVTARRALDLRQLQKVIGAK